MRLMRKENIIQIIKNIKFKYILSSVCTLIFSLVIFLFLTLYLLFPSASLDDYYVHLNAYFNSHSIENQTEEKVSSEKRMINGASVDELRQDTTLNLITNNLPFDIQDFFFTKFMSSKNVYQIIALILLVYSFVTIMFIYAVLKKVQNHKYTSRALVISIIILLFYLLFKILNVYFKEDHLKKEYIDPQVIIEKSKISPAKNLLVLYVESLETGFSNKSVFGKDLLEPLKNLGGTSMKMIANIGTTNSLSGINASLCSVPLYTFYSNTKNLNQVLDSRLCLGNILDHYGYVQSTIQGTTRSNIYTKEFANIFEKNNISFNGCEALVEKGYERSNQTFDGCFHNEEVLEETEAQLKRYSKNPDQKFHLSNFLIDTHGPRGLFANNCLKDELNDSNQIRGSMNCAIRNIDLKLRQWKARGYLDNTVVVIMGDHLFMPGFSNQEYFKRERFVHFQILNVDQDKYIPKRKYMNHFDVMPTILELLELLPEKQNRLGLGSSIFQDDPEFELRQSKFKDEYYLFSDL